MKPDRGGRRNRIRVTAGFAKRCVLLGLVVAVAASPIYGPATAVASAPAGADDAFSESTAGTSDQNAPATPAPSPAQPSPTEPPRSGDSDIQDLLYLAPTRPLIIRLHVQIDGRGFTELLDDYCQKLFESYDADGDGLLDSGETAELPTPMQLAPAGDREALSQSIAVGPVDSNPRDGHVTREELRDYVQRAVGTPFRIVAEQPRAQVEANLFSRLDVDSDGNLGFDELPESLQSLRQFDVDDDELVAATELRPPTQQMQAAGQGETSQASVNSLMSLLFPIDRIGTGNDVIRRLLRTYDDYARDETSGFFTKDGQLSAGELGLPPAAIEPHDANSDGKLNARELREYLRNPAPWLELQVDLAAGRAERPRFTVLAAGEESNNSVISARQLSQARVALTIAGVQLDLDAAPPLGDSIDYKEQYKRLFAAVDGDNNEYLDNQEAQRIGMDSGLYTVVDRDRNDKVFLPELLRYIDLQSTLAKTTTTLTVSNQTKTLFDMIDADGDSRISLREMGRVRQQLTMWDHDGDEKVSAGELPSNYRMQFGVGRRLDFGNPAVQLPQANSGVAELPQTTGPLWFRKMDRNRDGDVSQREFLGPLDVFARLDADGDGLLAPKEAAAASQ